MLATALESLWTSTWSAPINSRRNPLFSGMKLLAKYGVVIINLRNNITSKIFETIFQGQLGWAEAVFNQLGLLRIRLESIASLEEKANILYPVSPSVKLLAFAIIINKKIYV